METDIPVFIIPSAGFGKRMNCPNAKEAMIHPSHALPLIGWSLQRVKASDAIAHVVTRPDKTDLIDYLSSQDILPKSRLRIQMIEPTKEWPETVLKSESGWGEKNILLLPDTRFEPLEIADLLLEDLKNNELSIAYFTSEDQSKWGNFIFSHPLRGCEKPRFDSCDPQLLNKTKSWGLLGFKASAGRLLFEKLLESTLCESWYEIDLKYSKRELSLFTDLTRKPWD